MSELQITNEYLGGALYKKAVTEREEALAEVNRLKVELAKARQKSNKPIDNIEQLKADSRMLSRIAACVEGFSENDEDTAIICVLRLLARYHDMESDNVYDAIELEQRNNER